MFPLGVEGQYFQYSQHNFTDQRVNPAMVSSSDYASASIIFRNQRTGGDISLKSSMLSAVYPFLGSNGKRWSGLGVSLMDDRSGGIFAVQEAALSYAINVYVSRFQFLSLGLKGLYQQRRVNMNGLYTGSQYIHDRGFDETLFSGENFGLLRSNFTTFSAGLYWQESDRQGRRIAWWGVSFFDFNKPHDSFSGTDHHFNSTFVASGGIRLGQRDNVSFTPEALFTRSAGRNFLNIGFVTSFEVRQYRNQIGDRLDLITKYVPGRSGVLGVQLHREEFSFGFSYDFPLAQSYVANTGAFEVALQVKRLVDPAKKRNASARRRSNTTDRVPGKSRSTENVPAAVSVNRDDAHKADSIGAASVVEVEPPLESQRLRSSLQEKSDSVMARAKAGRLSHEPFVIEKINLRFNFKFNSAELDAPSMEYLDELSAALKENVHMKVKLTGHTDNLGSAAFNMRLSRYRANVVREYLIERGVDPSKIKADGKGLSEPLNENVTEAERALNRRVELLIYYQE